MLNYDLKNIYEWPLVARSVIIVIICSIVFYIAYFMDFSSQQHQLLVARQQEDDLKQQLSAVFKTQAELQQDIEIQIQLKKNLAETQQKLVKPANIPELLNELLKIGAASGLQFNLFNPGKEEDETNYTKVPIKVISFGSYHQFANFISNVANLLPIIAVNDFEIQRPSSTSPDGKQATVIDANRLSSELILDVYYLNGNKPDETKKL